MSNSEPVGATVIQIAVYHYAHIMNMNTNVVRLLLGPKTYVCMQDEKLVLGPKSMITVKPIEYCIIRNPVIRTAVGEPVLGIHGQVTLKVGDEDYRFSQDPFPLYPGEEMVGGVQPLHILSVHTALRLRAVIAFVDEKETSRLAGDQWIFEGPGYYRPRKEVEVLCEIEAKIILPNTALCIEASQDCVDRNGIDRVCGEQWLVQKPGVYLPSAYETIVETREAHKITDKEALQVKALVSHTDKFGKKHKFGEKWLITSEETDSHICSVHEKFVRIVDIEVLNKHQYCVINNPVDSSGVQHWGQKRLVRGETSFFLKPGEEFDRGTEESYVLEGDESLILCATEKFIDEVDTTDPSAVDVSPEKRSTKRQMVRNPGDQWTIRGPMEYVPPVQVGVVSQQKLILLDLNEGVYVRNERTGIVRAVIGQAYMLTEDESLWYKPLPKDVIELLSKRIDPQGHGSAHSKRAATAHVPDLDLSKVVTYQVPHNAAVQIYDYRGGKARVEFGPTLVMLGTDEQFTKLSLSGGKPKRPNVIKSLCLLLGPDFFTDIVVVETADHARLSLKLSYNWVFEVPKPCSPEEAAKLFAVPDFVGDACKSVASRVRGVVAGVEFDDFHKNSARIIRSSVFGLDSDGKVLDRLVFAANNLTITNIDVQSVEPVEQRTRDALQKSVQIAIEITTNSLEATARHEAERLEQEARGRLARQRIQDESSAEEARRVLLENRILLESLESTGKARAEAESRAESARIENEAAVLQATLRAEALAIETDAELERLGKAREAELSYIAEKDIIRLKQKKEERLIDAQHFASIIDSLGQDTLRTIATASADQNVRMLSALGLQSTLITDGTTPVNLLTTAHGLIGKVMESAGGGDGDAFQPHSQKSLVKVIPTGTFPHEREDIHVGDGDSLVA